MANLSVRGLQTETLDALKTQAGREGKSLNAMVVQLLQNAVGGKPKPCPHTDLDALAGTWSSQDAADFTHATAAFRAIDADLWDSA
ncbi:MAG: hypothetical protein H7842_08860 [Gammaproteobacteria bacterium SHHR-1]|uniref:FitA-like ribbon-helix-helix domain-containing protein n=1 Tax=Magnetovirga frankeli TaxID=947516 RepID=UPI001293C9DE|nr:hypothetical protein D5125_03345 [gamma proteobacterium SS-5]